jgi:hypothetical protein
MSCSLVFIERLDEIDLLESFINADTIVISMLPSVSSELKRRGISFETTLSFFGVEGHRQTLEKSLEITEEFRPFLKKIKIEDVQHAFEKTWIVYFRIYLNYWLAMVYIVDNAVKENKPDTLIVICKNSANKPSFKPSENYYLLNTIVEQYGFSHNIKIQYEEKGENFKVNNYYWKLINNWLKSCVFEFQLSIFSLMKRDRASILALEDTYNMPRLLSEVCQRNDKAFPVYLSIKRNTFRLRLREMLKGETFSFLCIPSRTKLNISTNLQEQLGICVSQIRGWLNNHPETLTIFGVNASTYLLSYIENTLNHKMLDLNAEITSLKRLLNIVKPNKVFSQHSLGITYALGEICLRNDIAALLISHGSHVPHNQSLAESEWSIHAHTIINSHYPFVAIQTPWVKKFLNAQDGVISKSIETGPLLFARKQENDISKQKLRKKIFGSHLNKRIILHAGSPRVWKTLRPWVYETCDEYINNLNDVIKAIDSLPNIYLAIRFRPQEKFTLEDLRMSLINSNCYGIYIDGVFEDYLLGSDLLLSYSSATIEEALQNHVPVLQYDPSGKYEHIPGRILSTTSENKVSAIYSVLSEVDLMPALQWWSKSFEENNHMMRFWSEHILDFDSKMDWLSRMDSKKC